MSRSTTPPSSVGASAARWRGCAAARPRVETYWLVFLVALTLLCGVLVAVWPDFWPMTLLVVPMVLAHLVLGPRNLPWFVVFVLAVLTGLAVVVTSTAVLTSRTVDRRRGDLRGRLHRAADVVPPLPARGRGRAWASRCWSTCATGS